MKAVGAYLQTLREGRGLSRAWVADRAGTNGTNIYRIEMLGQEPRPRMLVGFVKTVQGSFEDIDELLKDDDLPVDVGVKLAEMRLSSEGKQVREHINGYTDDDLARVRAELTDDPDFLDAIAREILRRARG